MSLSAVLFFVLFFLTGLLVGSFSSVVGGGALILIPLYNFLGVPLASAIATMRLSAAVSQGSAVTAFIKEKKIEWRSALWVSLCCLPGAYLGAHLVVDINQTLLGYIVTFFMVALLAVMLLYDQKKFSKKRHLAAHRWLILTLTGFLLGVYGGFYGAGFSTVLMLVFYLAGGVSLITSSANASVATFCMSIIASVFFAESHLIRWDIMIPVSVGGIIGSWIGVESAVKLGMGWIKVLLCLVVAASVAKLVFWP